MKKTSIKYAILGLFVVSTAFATLWEPDTITDKGSGDAISFNEFNKILNVLRGITVDDKNTTSDLTDDVMTFVGASFHAKSFVYTSDERLKKDIEPIDGAEALDKIKQLQGVYYNWKSNDEATIGFLAQAVEKIFPQLVYTDKDGMKSMNYAGLISPLVEAFKVLEVKQVSQQQEIDLLKEEIAAIKAQLQ